MANAEKTFEQGVAVGMLLAKSSNTKDQLLDYILQNATLIATCKHTSEYTIKYYQGVISKQDPNLNLFTKELINEKYTERFTYKRVGEFSDDYTKQYGTMSFLNMAEIEDYFTYFSKILFKNDKPLYGDADIIYLGTNKTSFQILPIYSARFEPGVVRVVKEYVAFVDYRYIPKIASYIGDYNSKMENVISTYHHNELDVDIEYISSRNIKYYDNNGNVVDYQKNLEVPIECIGYTYDYDMGDDTKRPVVSEKSRYTSTQTYVFFMDQLPKPNLIGDLTLSELNDIFFDYLYKRHAESIPQSYMNNTVRSEILPYPSESETTE